MENSAHQCANAHQSFFVKEGMSVPRKILLVDDVFTSGSTLDECRKALRRRYGMQVRISIATLAFVGAV